MAPTSALKSLDIPDFFASGLVYILRTITLASFIGLILLLSVPSKQEHIVWVVPVYSVLFIHRILTYVSQLICTLSLAPLTLSKPRDVGHVISPSSWLAQIFPSVSLNLLVEKATSRSWKSSLIYPLALFVHHHITIRTNRWSSQTAIAFAAVSWILMIIVGIEIVLRFCIYALNIALIPTDSKPLSIPSQLTQRFPNPFKILTGCSVWEGHFV